MKNLLVKILLTSALLAFNAEIMADDWNSSPNNWNNSSQNWENSSQNWKNSPQNWDNSPSRYGNDRIIRDESGNARGYVVPKADGGLNVYDNSGNRILYLPSK